MSVLICIIIFQCIQEWQILKGKGPITKCVFCSQSDTDISTFCHAYFTGIEIEINLFKSVTLLSL